MNSFARKNLSFVRGKIALTLAATTILTSVQAQIQTAGNLYVNVDATTQPAGPLNTIPNTGVLGGLFQARTAAGAAANSTNVLVNGANGIQFSGTFCMPLVNGVGGPFIPPPGGLVGPNATATIEVWVLNPAVADDECMVSWGRRGTGQNMAFEYGVNATLGAVTHTSSADMPWDSSATIGAPVSSNWHHLVYTYDGITQSVYVDGVLVNSKATSFNIATNAGIALGAQWLISGTAISTAPALATLTMAKVRVHDGALSATQVLNNFNFEKAAFNPAPAPQFLSKLPVHRYSFYDAQTNNAIGLPIVDSIGIAHGVVRGTNGAIVPEFARGRLIVWGGSPATTSYGDLPNGLLSSNSTNNGGTGEFSIEVWYRNMGNVASSRVFDIGAPGILATAGPGVEVPGVGGYPVGGVGLDYFFYSAQVGANVNQRRLAWQNRDPLPGGQVTNAPAISTDVITFGSFQNDRHIVVTWNESSSQIIAYENGFRVSSLTPTNSMASINDVNVWLGRSVNTDSGFVGEFDEVRLYTNILSHAEIVGNFLAGADTLNASEQAATILASPQGVSTLQGFPVTFSVLASGSPAVSYQWRRNTAPIAGATNNVLNLVASLENSGAYSVVVSNFANGSPHSQTTTDATLLVTPSKGSPSQFLHETRDGNRDNFTGLVGGHFQVGSSDAVITHLGYYDINNDGLLLDHRVGIYPIASGSAPLVTVTVPAGTGALLTNGHRWVALDSPFILRANESYIVQAEVFNLSGDGWPDVQIPGNWNPYYVGTNGPPTRSGRFITAGVWGAYPASSGTLNGIYAAPNLAVLPTGPITAITLQTNVTQYATTTLTLNAFANGEGAISVQWYKAPSTLLPGQTNLSLVLPNLSAANAGDYYIIATDSLAATAQSGNVTVVVTPDAAVNITQEPDSLDVPNGFPATFSVTAVGTPSISYQWRVGGAAIPGATNSSYTIPAVSFANNGQVYSVVASNFALGTLQSDTSVNATLTVLPNQAQPQHILYATVAGSRNNHSGSVGGLFQVGASDVVVTHLGFYDSNDDGLVRDHRVGIYTSTPATTNSLFAVVTVPPGTEAYLTNGYRWVALPTPIILTNNASYILSAEVFSGDGDAWPDVATRIFDEYYIGSTEPIARAGRFSSVAWPAFPGSLSGGANTMFGAPNLAVLPIGPAVASISSTNITKYVGENATFTAVINGEAPLTVQWYKAPNLLLSGQTNLTLTLASLTLADAGEYYVEATNPHGPVNSANATLNVLALTSPAITEQPENQTVYVNQRAIFSVTAIGQQPLNYQWKFGAIDIPDATNATLTVIDTSTASAGNYSVTITNTLGFTNSQTASLTVLTLPEGSYASAISDTKPLIYYRFSDVLSGGDRP